MSRRAEPCRVTVSPVLRLRLALLVAALVLAGCAGTGGRASDPSPTRSSSSIGSTSPHHPIAECVPVEAQSVSLGTKDVPVEGVILGAGTAGVVLLNQSNRNLCQWFPYAAQLAQRKLQVLLFNESWAVESAVKALRDHGAKRVVLVGASAGARDALAAATEISPPVEGVASLSAEKHSDLMPLLSDLKVPVLLVSAAEDGFAPTKATLDIAAEIPESTSKRTLIVPGDAHGVELLSTAASERVRPALRDFLAERLRLDR